MYSNIGTLLRKDTTFSRTGQTFTKESLLAINTLYIFLFLMLLTR